MLLLLVLAGGIGDNSALDEQHHTTPLPPTTFLSFVVRRKANKYVITTRDCTVVKVV